MTEDYNALFKINSDGKSSSLSVKITDKNNEEISVEYIFNDELKNHSVKFQNPPVPTWKRYFD